MENHARTGAQFLSDRGYPEVGHIVRQHVVLDEYFASEELTEAEIVNYADKRVLHDQVVSLKERKYYILEKTNKDIPLFGGLAADDLTIKNTWVFTNNKLCNDGIVFLIIDNDKIEMSGLATSGWEAVGIEKTITWAEGNRVYTIDNKPAMDVFIKYYDLPADLDAAAEVMGSIGSKFPLQVFRKNRPPVLRTPLYGIKEDKSLVFAGKIPQGAKVKFSVLPTFEIIDSTIENMKSEVLRTKKADALIMFSCKARQVALGPLMEDEVSGIRKIWNAPMVGLFTYGEIGKTLVDQTDFHNETCSLVILNEK